MHRSPEQENMMFAAIRPTASRNSRRCSGAAGGQDADARRRFQRRRPAGRQDARWAGPQDGNGRQELRSQERRDDARSTQTGGRPCYRCPCPCQDFDVPERDAPDGGRYAAVGEIMAKLKPRGPRHLYVLSSQPRGRLVHAVGRGDAPHGPALPGLRDPLMNIDPRQCRNSPDATGYLMRTTGRGCKVSGGLLQSALGRSPAGKTASARASQ